MLPGPPHPDATLNRVVVRAARGLHAPRSVIVAGLLLLAAAVRLAVARYHDLAGDDAMVALMARHILGGAFPTFFYGEAYHGSLTAALFVPSFYLFGSSVLVLRVTAVLYSLLFPLGLYLLGRRVFDEATGRVVLLLAAVPPFLVTLWSALVTPHLMASMLGVVLLLLALTASEASGPRYVRLLVCLGVGAGLAWWTFFGVLEVLVPALVMLWVRDLRLPLRRAGACLLGGFILGSLPAWLSYVAYGDPTGNVRRLFEFELAPSVDRLGAVLHSLRTVLLGWHFWPPDTVIRGVTGLVTVGVYVAACGAVLAEQLRRHGKGTQQRRARGVWLLLAILLTTFAALYAARWADFRRDTTRYVLPAYISLLPLAAAFVVRVGRRSRPLGALLLAFLLAYNVWTNWPALWPFLASERAWRAAHVASREALRSHLKEHGVEALYVETPWSSLRWAFLLPRIHASDLSGELYLPNAGAADAAERVAILLERRGDAVIRALDTVGATYRTTDFGDTRLLDEIRIPFREYRFAPRASWRVRDEGVTPSVVADGDLGTAWPAGAAGADEVVVDLGRLHAVGRVVWWPSPEPPRGPPLALSVSEDGTTWNRVGVQPSPEAERRPAFVVGGRPVFRLGNSWLEARFAPRRVRFIRFAPAEPLTAGRWGVAELYVYEDVGPGREDDPGTDALVALLRSRGVGRLLADPVTSARVAQATGGTLRTLPVQFVADSLGRPTPAARLTRPVALRATDGLLVPVEDAEDLRTRLSQRGVEFREVAAGDYVLFHGLSPVTRTPHSGWAWAGRTLFLDSGPAQ